MGLVVVIVIVWQSISVYQSAMAEKETATDMARQKAMDEYFIKHINHITFYHGKKDYHVVDASLENGRHVFLWIPDKKGGRYLMRDVSDGYSKSEILNAFKSHVPYKKIISIRLGLEDDTPVWEITYIDNDGSYVFSYYDFETGDSIKSPISIQ
jgi:uncharacterized protein YpmB